MEDVARETEREKPVTLHRVNHAIWNPVILFVSDHSHHHYLRGNPSFSKTNDPLFCHTSVQLVISFPHLSGREQTCPLSVRKQLKHEPRQQISLHETMIQVWRAFFIADIFIVADLNTVYISIPRIPNKIPWPFVYIKLSILVLSPKFGYCIAEELQRTILFTNSFFVYEWWINLTANGIFLLPVIMLPWICQRACLTSLVCLNV